MRIPPEKVEEVRQAADILEVVGDYVKLKKRGSNYFGLSPFKQEKTPSFSVHPGKGIFKCFATGIGGDVFSFLREKEGIPFYEAVRLLANRYGVVLPEETAEAQERADEKESIYAALRWAARFYYSMLTQEAAGQKGLAYLEGRGFTPKTIKHFGLGYAPDAWDVLLNAATKAHFAPEILEMAGLIIPRKDGSGFYDRYRGRVIFPIFSHLGKVIGFGGRILDATSDQPKYINSPETQVYDKGSALYGLFQAKKDIHNTEEVVFVEGYTDVVSLHQAGFNNVVATCGTSVTSGHIKLLGRFAKKIVMLYDSDSAGLSAISRSFDSILDTWISSTHSLQQDIGQLYKHRLAGGLRIDAVFMPEGQDPDTMIAEYGYDRFRHYIDVGRLDFVEFRYELARRMGRLDTAESRVAVQYEIMETIARIDRPLVREQLVRRLGEVAHVPDVHIFAELDRIILHKRKQELKRSHNKEEDRSPVTSGHSVADSVAASPPREIVQPIQVLPEEQVLLRVMLERGAGMVEFILGHMALDEFTEGPPREMAEKLLEQYQEGRIESDEFTSGAHGAALQRLATDVLADMHTLSENWERKRNIVVPGLNEDAHEAAASAMTLLKLDRVDEAIAAQRRAVHAAEKGAGDPTEALYRLTRLQQLRKSIEARKFLVGG